eukprot:scaffold14615_cov65-Cyclotella_meneghiniana.AAC.10
MKALQPENTYAVSKGCNGLLLETASMKGGEARVCYCDLEVSPRPSKVLDARDFFRKRYRQAR